MTDNTVTDVEDKANKFVATAAKVWSLAWNWVKVRPVVLAIVAFLLGFMVG